MSARVRRIVCVGSRLAEADDAGPRVHDRLAASTLPAGVELLDGGLRGLDLVPLLEGAARVVLVDNVEGYGRPGEVVVIEGSALVEGPPPAYGHGNGLAYALRALPVVCEGDLPEVVLVGVEGRPDEGTVQAMAETCVRLVAR